MLILGPMPWGRTPNNQFFATCKISSLSIKNRSRFFYQAPPYNNSTCIYSRLTVCQVVAGVENSHAHQCLRHLLLSMSTAKPHFEPLFWVSCGHWTMMFIPLYLGLAIPSMTLALSLSASSRERNLRTQRKLSTKMERAWIPERLCGGDALKCDHESLGLGVDLLQ